MFERRTEDGLTQIISQSLSQPVPEEARALAAEIRRRYGSSVAAILFYGSCLRTPCPSGGIWDFYVLVDSYEAAYTSHILAWLNTLLPPNVFYLEVKKSSDLLRAKYAVISVKDFMQGASFRHLSTGIWARFCQPTLLVYARDAQAQAAVVEAMVRAVLTMIAQVVALFSASGRNGSFWPEDIWKKGFQETYRAELRAEKPQAIEKIYKANPEYYDRLARAALLELERQSFLQVRVEGRRLQVALPPCRWARLVWGLRRLLAKGRYAVWLLKSAATFKEWFPYVLWKLGRHTGVWIQPNERQRRYPLLWAWPVVLRFLLRRDLR